MIDQIVPLISSFLPMWQYVLIYIFAGYLLVFVFNFISGLLRGA